MERLDSRKRKWNSEEEEEDDEEEMTGGLVPKRNSTHHQVRKLPKGILRRCETNVNLCLLMHHHDKDIINIFDRVNLFAPNVLINKVELAAFGRSGFIVSITHAMNTTIGNRKQVRETKFISALKFSIISRERDPDNILYESFVGREVINFMADRFPLFIKTYHLYHMKERADIYLANQYAFRYLNSLPESKRVVLFPDDPRDYFLFPTDQQQDKTGKRLVAGYEAENGEMAAETLLQMFRPGTRSVLLPTRITEENMRTFRIACRDSRQLVTQFEYIDHSTTLLHFLQEEFGQGAKTAFFWNFECANILFQLYGPLSALRKEFTHYDVHLNNIMVADLDRHHIILKYHYKGKTVRIASKFILKLIDYGRCYTPRTNEFRDILCKVCNPQCGKYRGFRYLNANPRETNKAHTYIQPRQKNISHDLRAAYLLRKLILEKEPENMKQEFESNDFPGKAVRNLIRNVHFEHHFGTPERETMKNFDPQQALLDSTNSKNRIMNVHDLFETVFLYCTSNSFDQHLSMYDHLSKAVGEMDIYLDEESRHPLRFVPLVQ
jgi:uncharacterized C2H2 Zn-finger protein